MHLTHGGLSTAYQNEYGARVKPGPPPWAVPKAGMGWAVGPENSGRLAFPALERGSVIRINVVIERRVEWVKAVLRTHVLRFTEPRSGLGPTLTASTRDSTPSDRGVRGQCQDVPGVAWICCVAVTRRTTQIKIQEFPNRQVTSATICRRLIGRASTESDMTGASRRRLGSWSLMLVSDSL
jgi:hypothetical protein